MPGGRLFLASVPQMPVPWRLAFPTGLNGQGNKRESLTAGHGRMRLARQLVEELPELADVFVEVLQPGAWAPDFHAQAGSDHEHFTSLFDL